MSNHSSKPDPELEKKLGELRDQLRDQSLELGATGRHPRGAITKQDEGELRFAVANDGRTVLLDFGKPVAWLGMPAASARELARLLIAHAEQVETATAKRGGSR